MSQSFFELSHKSFEKIFKENASKQWHEWLTIDQKSSENFSQGKQGYTGTLAVLGNAGSNKVRCVFKISKVDDNLVEHEYNIINSLEELSNYCPHFHKCYGILPFESNVHFMSHPLKPKELSKCITRNMLLMQHIPSKCNFREFLDDTKVSDENVLSIIKQVIVAIWMSHSVDFTHYDLHSQNILIRNCNPNLFVLYILKDKTILIPTFGNIANIIDFGFAYSGSTSDKTLSCTLVHTKYGFTSARFDPFADIKLFLITLVDDLRHTHRSSLHRTMYNIIRNIFIGIKIDWESGWDNSKHIDPVRLIQNMVSEYTRESALFSQDNLWIETIQQLIDLPLSRLPYHDLGTAFRSFINEFVKFEERIASKTLLNYVLKILVKQVKTFRAFYLQGGEQGTWAVIEIKKHFLEEYTKIIKYHNPSIDYNQMICSLLLIAQCMEGLFYDCLQKRYEEKDKQNDVIRLRNMDEFFSVIDANFPSLKTLSNKSSIHIVDHVRKSNSTFSLKQEHVQIAKKFANSTQTAKYVKNIYLSNIS